MNSCQSLNKIIEKPMSGEWGTESTGEGVNVLRTTNFTNEGRLNISRVVKRNIPAKKIESKKLLNGDIIIEKSGGSPKQPVGRVVFFEEDGLFLCNNFTSILRPKQELVFPKYLHYILYCNHSFGLTKVFQNKTTGIINLQLARYVSETQIPLPPLPVQQKIAAILDAADALKQKDKALIAKYDELTQSLFLDMFGDPVTNTKGVKVVTLEEITTKITDGVHAKPDYTEKGIPFISVKDITTGTLFFDNCKFISEEAHNKYIKRCKPEYMDILYTKVGATYGRPAIVNKNIDFSLYVSVALLKPNKELINPFFLKEAMANPAVKRQADKSIKGIGVPDLHLNMIKKIIIPFPSLLLQNQFAERVKAIEKQKQQAQECLQKSEDLFSCLLQKAFKGELVT